MQISRVKDIIQEEIENLVEYDEWKNTRIQAKNIFRMLKQKYKSDIPKMKKGLELILKQNRTKDDQAQVMWSEFNKYFKIKEGFERVMFPHVKTLKKLTANNAKTESYIMVAKALGDDKLISAFEKIQQVQDRKGHLPNDLYEKRFKLYQQLMKKSKAKFINHKEVYGSL